nr:hypothetical protein [uncultured Blautia sp.]
MTYYDQESQFLRQRLQKEIPILTALIQNLYKELDRKFHLNGAKVPVTFGFDTDSLGSYTRQSAHEDEHFHFSLLFIAQHWGQTPMLYRTVSVRWRKMS